MKSIMAELGSITAGMMEKQEDTITSLTAENKRMAVEVEAWRGGLLERGLCVEGMGGDLTSGRCFFIRGIPFNTITEAVDALMKEK